MTGDMMDSIQDLEQRLAELERQAAAPNAALEAKHKEAELLARIREKENEIRDLPKIADLEGAQGEDYEVIRCRHGFVAVRPPKAVEWKRFTEATKGSTRDHGERLVMACALYPAKDELRRLFDVEPAALDAICVTLGDMAGSRAERVSGKS